MEVFHNIALLSKPFPVESLSIQLDKTVNSITKAAAMALSGYIANGIILSQNSSPIITIYKDRIEFSKNSNNQDYSQKICLIPNYYVESGILIYKFKTIKFLAYNRQLDYDGIFAPKKPDNVYIYNAIYPEFS